MLHQRGLNVVDLAAVFFRQLTLEGVHTLGRVAEDTLSSQHWILWRRCRLVAWQVYQTQSLSGYVFSLTNTVSKACKRSYRRALRRALHSEGSTTTCQGRKVGHPNDRHVGHRLHILSLNIGGIDTDAYDHLTAWLQTSPCDILLLQEVRHGPGR